MQSRATYVGHSNDPQPGSTGIAFPASGYEDPESAEQGAYLFQPDGSEHAYYVDPKLDLVFEEGNKL